MANIGIKNSWPLVAFAKIKGKMQVGSFKTTAEDGSERSFKSCIFTDPAGNRCFVSFSSNMGELTPAEISAQKADLQVVELESGNFSLCRTGSNSWLDVEL